ncbi:MAG: hypothetical protein K2P94_18040 [Rhodospirillaceae bacterium]|nr:hypothetical protein [Rhodospirillaceae bacterium]
MIGNDKIRAQYKSTFDRRLCIPDHFPNFDALNRCLPGGGFVEVPDIVMHGAKDNGDGTYKNPKPSATLGQETPQPTKAEIVGKLQELICAIHSLPVNKEVDNIEVMHRPV